MKNRYLLLITLITGLTTEVAQASDSLKELASLPIAYKAVFNALPQDHTAAKAAATLYAPPARLTQEKELRENTYSATHNYLMQYNIKPEYANWYLKTTENLILAEGQKYDPDFGSRFKSWCLSHNWATSGTTTITYKMPSHCMKRIIVAENESKFSSMDRAFFHHERGHDYLNHLPERLIFLNKMAQKKNFVHFYTAKTKEDFLQISNKKELLDDLVSYYYFCIKQENEADAFVPDDATLVAAATKAFTFLDRNSTVFDPNHPSDAKRAKYFRNRFKTLLCLKNETSVGSLIEKYTKDFHVIINNDNDHLQVQQKPSVFPDEYSVYCVLKPAILIAFPSMR